MAICHPLVPKFIDLCDLPAIDRGLANNSLTIEIFPIQVYDYGSSLAATIHCKSLKRARSLASRHHNLMTALIHLEIAELYIKVNGKTFTVLSNFMFYFGIFNVPKVDINELFNSPEPIYMITMESEKLVLANSAAVLANQKNFQDFIGDDFSCLSYPDELENRKSLLRRNRELKNHEFTAMHWYNDNGKWRRQEVELVVDLQLINFWGTECRLGIELVIEETKRFVD